MSVSKQKNKQKNNNKNNNKSSKNNFDFIELYSYNKNVLEKKVLKQKNFESEIKKIKNNKNKVFWINIVNAKKNVFTKKVCDFLKVHPLIQEDIKSNIERPKVEELEDILFVLLKDFDVKIKSSKKQNFFLEENQTSFILKDNIVVSFQNSEEDFLKKVSLDLEKEKLKLRKKKASFLLYYFIDFITDNYYEKLEKIGDYLEDLEEQLLKNEDKNLLDEIYFLKRNLITLRNDLWPLREIIHKLSKNYHYFFDKETILYFSDTYDHTIIIIELIEEYRDLLSGMIDLYLSKLSNKMNETMTVLTVIGTIFIPLTFITGVYGMNFKNMPILYWDYGYYYIWLVMILLGMGMLYYFKKKKWF